MNIISWNVNGLKSLIKNNYLEILIQKYNPDIICLSETKLSEDMDISKYNYLENYKFNYFNNSKIKKGYAGTCIFSKIQPNTIEYFDDEGRILTVEFNNYILINIYTPNSGVDLKRLEYRISWEKKLRKYIKELQKKKSIIICGDLNVAHNEIDIKNPKSNINNAGFTKEERNEFNNLLIKNNITDIFRNIYPQKIEYTYWSYRHNSREKNIGWRLDYFLIEKNNINNIKNIKILTNIFGSDHAPLQLLLKNNI